MKGKNSIQKCLDSLAQVLWGQVEQYLDTYLHRKVCDKVQTSRGLHTPLGVLKEVVKRGEEQPPYIARQEREGPLGEEHRVVDEGGSPSNGGVVVLEKGGLDFFLVVGAALFSRRAERREGSL